MRQTLRNEEIHQRFSISEIKHLPWLSLVVYFDIRMWTGVQSPPSDNEIVSPGFMTRSWPLTSRFFSSRSNSSGVPVSSGQVPYGVGWTLRGFTGFAASAAGIG